MVGISIIICCYNSAKRLPDTLRYLSCQNNDVNIPWEIIIVDNNSGDDTQMVAISEWGKYELKKIGFRIVEEKKMGLSNARNKGVAVAKYDLIIFCDDDNLLCKDYLQVAFQLMNDKPDVGVLGGEGIAVADVDFPNWWDEVSSSYAVGKQAEKSGYVNDRGYVWGSGMVTRKHLLERVFDKRFPSLLSDRKGEALTSGGDSEICLRALFLNYNLYYDERLCYKHYITSNRLSLSYKENLFEGHREADVIIRKYQKVLGYKKKKLATRLLTSFSTIKYILDTQFKKTSINRNHIYHELYLELFLEWEFNFIPCDSDYKKIVRFKKKQRKYTVKKEKND